MDWNCQEVYSGIQPRKLIPLRICNQNGRKQKLKCFRVSLFYNTKFLYLIWKIQENGRTAFSRAFHWNDYPSCLPLLYDLISLPPPTSSPMRLAHGRGYVYVWKTAFVSEAFWLIHLKNYVSVSLGRSLSPTFQKIHFGF